MTSGQILVTLEKIEPGIKGHFVMGSMGDGFYIQLRLHDAGEFSGCRKWYISSHATVSEVVQTAFLAVKVAQEHELRESFKFLGKSIFGPHQSATALAMMNIPHDVREG